MMMRKTVNKLYCEQFNDMFKALFVSNDDLIKTWNEFRELQPILTK